MSNWKAGGNSFTVALQSPSIRVFAFPQAVHHQATVGNNFIRWVNPYPVYEKYKQKDTFHLLVKDLTSG